jgi:HD superfamily phosphohydrolase
MAMMFSQVYFHKVRVILDYHLHHAVQAMRTPVCAARS